MAKTRAQKRWEHYKALQRQEVNRLRKVLETYGGSFSWYDYEEEDWKDGEELPNPVVLVNWDHYAGDVAVKRVTIENGPIVIEATESPESYSDLTLHVEDIAFGHIDFITDCIPNKK